MTTYHSIKRAQKRAGLSKTSATRLIEKAVMHGQKAEHFDSVERDYLHQKASIQGHQSVVYDRYCFIVSNDNVCVTMFPLPSWFGKKRQYNNKNKTRDAKRIIRNYLYEEPEDELLDYCPA